MRSQVKLGGIFGTEIALHYSWFLIALLIAFSISGQFHASNPQWGDFTVYSLALATALLFFVPLLLHELAHSLVSKSNGSLMDSLPRNKKSRTNHGRQKTIPLLLPANVFTPAVPPLTLTCRDDTARTDSVPCA